MCLYWRHTKGNGKAALVQPNFPGGTENCIYNVNFQLKICEVLYEEKGAFFFFSPVMENTLSKAWTCKSSTTSDHDIIVCDEWET